MIQLLRSLLCLAAFTCTMSLSAEVHDGGENRCSINAFVGVTQEVPSATKVEKLKLPAKGGAFLTSIVGCSGAAEAGLRPFDYLYAVDGKTTTADMTFFCMLEDKGVEVGDRVKVKVWRKGKSLEKTLVLGRRNINCDQPDPYPIKGQLGILHSRSDEKLGVVVNVTGNSAAERMGMQNGDRLLSMAGYPIVSWNDISVAKRNLESTEAVAFVVERNGKNLTLKGDLDPYQAPRAYGVHSLREDDCIDVQIDRVEIEREIQNALVEVERSLQDLDLEETARVAMVEASRGLEQALAELRGEMQNEEWDEEIEVVNLRAETVPADEAEITRLTQTGVTVPQRRDLDLRDFQVSPNPSGGRFQLQFELPSRGQTVIAIYTADGREVYHYDLGTYGGRFNDEMDVARNGAGTYYLTVVQDGRAFVRKLLFTQP